MLEKAPSTLVLLSLWLDSDGPSLRFVSEFREHREYRQSDISFSTWARTLPSMAHRIYLSYTHSRARCIVLWTGYGLLTARCLRYVAW
jgi:hypothetical protein